VHEDIPAVNAIMELGTAILGLVGSNIVDQRTAVAPVSFVPGSAGMEPTIVGTEGVATQVTNPQGALIGSEVEFVDSLVPPAKMPRVDSIIEIPEPSVTGNDDSDEGESQPPFWSNFGNSQSVSKDHRRNRL
jgi:hypothetical protein